MTGVQTCALPICILKAANDGTYNFIEVVKEYGRRAARMKEIFLQNGFKLVYDYDLNEKLADGFYFTVSYPGFEGVDLIVELLYYGVSAIALETTGSIRTEGVRACVSQIADNQYDELDRRLACFRKDHPVQ